MPFFVVNRCDKITRCDRQRAFNFLGTGLGKTSCLFCPCHETFGRANANSVAATIPQIEGPFFKPRSPRRSDLREPGIAGRPVELSGLVLTRACRPVAGALVDLWQADDNGEYDNRGFRVILPLGGSPGSNMLLTAVGHTGRSQFRQIDTGQQSVAPKVRKRLSNEILGDRCWGSGCAHARRRRE
jgi:Dioxygenase